MNLNKAFLIGRLTADPQLRSTQAGQQVATFGLATNRVWNDKSGQKQEATEFHNIVVWGRQAEIAGRFLSKGSLTYIEGRLQTREWNDQQGQKRRTTEIVAERLQLGPRPGMAKSGAPPGTAAPAAQAAPEIPVIDVDGEIKAEDLPF